MKAPPGVARPTGGLSGKETRMADGQRLYNSVAPLRNVAALIALINRVQHRA